MNTLLILLVALCNRNAVSYHDSNFITTFDQWLLDQDLPSETQPLQPSYTRNDVDYLLGVILAEEGDYYEENLATTELPENIEEEIAQIVERKPEVPIDLLNLGFQAMSGGAGEGLQQLLPDGSVSNIQEVKSDANLPSYCSPPNPCPKGMTAADGCIEHASDTVEFNRRYIMRQMMDGLCTCDEEHMLPQSCPTGTTLKDADDDWLEIDNYLDYLINNEGDAKNPFMSVGDKRESLSAKKGSDLSMK